MRVVCFVSVETFEESFLHDTATTMHISVLYTRAFIVDIAKKTSTSASTRLCYYKRNVTFFRDCPASLLNRC